MSKRYGDGMCRRCGTLSCSQLDCHGFQLHLCLYNCLQACWTVARSNARNHDTPALSFWGNAQLFALQGQVPLLLNELLEAFPAVWAWAPADKERLLPRAWPSITAMKALGKRLQLVSRRDYGAAMKALFFPGSDTEKVHKLFLLLDTTSRKWPQMFLSIRLAAFCAIPYLMTHSHAAMGYGA